MKQTIRRLAAPVLAAALVLGAVATPAIAYFTASDQADGGLPIKWPDTDIKEKVGNGEKQVTIVNNEDSVPVWVRARAYCAEELEAEVLSGEAVDGELWTDAGDGWWNYSAPIDPGNETKTPLVVKIKWPFESSDVDETGSVTTSTDSGGETGGTTVVTTNTAEGTNYNIVVVYEAQPVTDDNASGPTWPYDGGE